jgi:hypothetical protein
MVRQGLKVLNGSQETFAYFFNYQGVMTLVILALAGSALVGSDFVQRSLTFYLAKPIQPRHYVAGKCLAVALIVHLITTVPALGLFAQHGLADWPYFIDADYFIAHGLGTGPGGWQLLLGILGYGLLASVFLSIVLVALASVLHRTMPLILGWVALFLFPRLVAGILVDGLRYDERWRLIDLWNNLGIVGRGCLGFPPERLGLPGPQPTMLAAGLTLLGVCIACLILLHRQTRSAPIVR